LCLTKLATFFSLGKRIAAFKVTSIPCNFPSTDCNPFTAIYFNDLAGTFNYEDLSYIGATTQLNNVIGRIFNSNKSPPGQKIPFHVATVIASDADEIVILHHSTLLVFLVAANSFSTYCNTTIPHHYQVV
jgi:hypothetical protein